MTALVEHGPGHVLMRAYLASYGQVTHRWCRDCGRMIAWPPGTTTLDALDWRRNEVQR